MNPRNWRNSHLYSRRATCTRVHNLSPIATENDQRRAVARPVWLSGPNTRNKSETWNDTFPPEKMDRGVWTSSNIHREAHPAKNHWFFINQLIKDEEFTYPKRWVGQAFKAFQIVSCIARHSILDVVKILTFFVYIAPIFQFSSQKFMRISSL